MNKVNKVVWGIIGAGDVCEKKSAPAMWSVAHSEVKTVMRRNAAKAEDFALRHGIKNWTTDLNQILNDPEINAIYIATPPDSHAELTIKAAQAGKAVYVEKPMANSVAECEAMISACANAGVPLFVAYYRPLLAGFLKVKELIDAGEIGEVRMVTIELVQALHLEIDSSPSNWRVDRGTATGGYFADLASHQLDYLDFLLGEIIAVQGLACNIAGIYNAEDTVMATFRFKNDIVGTGTWCFCANKTSESDVIRVLGSTGEIRFNCFGSPMVISLKTENKEDSTFSYTHAQPIQLPLIQEIVEELRGNAKTRSTGLSALKTNWVMEQILSKK